MGAQISYMGTKKHLASAVAGICEGLTDGPVLDAFAGLGAVGESLADRRNVWVNDCQLFASTASKTLFKSRAGPPPRHKIQCILEEEFCRNKKALLGRFPELVSEEVRYLKSGKLKDVVRGNTGLPHVGSCPDLETLRRRLARHPTTFPYRLATITYAGAYFGVNQCFELDSLRYAIDSARDRRSISPQCKQWLLLALCQVASKINNSTGQFAQYIKPKSRNLDRILEKRRRSVHDEFFDNLEHMAPIGSSTWRRNNLAFHSDALDLLPRLRRSERIPGVVYADPPYTNAEYSRYYHVLDMMLEYRYPPVAGAGRYPDKRKKPLFARVSTVVSAMQRLIKQSAELRVPLVISYPGNGILHRTGIPIEQLLLERFQHVDIAHSQSHVHSTFGGANATPTIRAKEFVYAATKPKAF